MPNTPIFSNTNNLKHYNGFPNDDMSPKSLFESWVVHWLLTKINRSMINI